jgi:capsular polysaccharide biosynthesis protein
MKSFVKKLLYPIIYSRHAKFSSDIRQRAEIKKWDIVKLNESYADDLTPPIFHGLDKDACSHIAVEKKMEVAAQYLVCIPDASTRAGYVRLSTGEFLAESTLRDEFSKNSTIYRARYTRHKLNLDGDCYHLDTLYSHNYGHWLSDDLPRLVSALPHLPSSTRFIVNNPLPEFKMESLTALGINPQSIVPVKGFCQARCERLWYVTPLNDMVWNSKNVLKVRNALWKSYARDIKTASRRNYISRNNLPSKRLINEEKILPLLESHGFSMNRPEKTSLSQQVISFYNAHLVLGPYGAGLINMLFCKDAKVIELQDALYAHRPWHWKWASLLGIPYSCVFGPVAETQGYLNTSFSIDPEALKPVLDKAIESVSQ